MKPIKLATVRADATNLERLLAQIPQGRAIVVSYCRQIALEDDRYQALIREYDTNKKADLGALCTTHNIEHADFLATVMKTAYPLIDEAMKLSQMISTGIVAARLPRVVERGMIEGAKRDGIADRHFTLQKEGFHVAPKGVSINMNQVNASAAGLPNFEDETRQLSDILAVDGELLEDHLLEAGETEYVEDEIEVEEGVKVA